MAEEEKNPNNAEEVQPNDSTETGERSSDAKTVPEAVETQETQEPKATLKEEDPATTNDDATGAEAETSDDVVVKPDQDHESTTRNERDWRERRDEERGRGRGRGRGVGRDRDGYERRNYKDNIKSEFKQPETDDPVAIRKQVEFYFSDSNLLTDKFLLSKVGGGANNPVPISVIHSFKRMRHFQPYSAVVAALRESELLVVTDKEEIVRKTPLPEDATEDPYDNVQLFEDKARSRSIYAKGFGEEDASTQVDIETFFAPYGPTNSIRLRRTFPEQVFKGSVFVEFENDELAKKFLELETKPQWKEQDLKIMSKEEYVRGKAEDVKHQRIEGNGRGRRGARGGGRGRGDRGGGRGRGRGRGYKPRRGGSNGYGRNDRDGDGDDEEVKTETDNAHNATPKAPETTESAPTNTESTSKKRSAEDNENAEDTSAKKAKVEEST